MNMDAYILHIETSGIFCSVSLAKNGETLAIKYIDEPNQHASKLTTLISRIIEEAMPASASLSAIAISQGPGSYTGLRIGVSTAKGLCYGWDIPLIAVPTLQAMFAGFAEKHLDLIEKNAGYIPMIDARRMEVYMMAFDAEGNVLEDTKALIVEESSLDSFFKTKDKMYIFGRGAEKLKELFEEEPRINCVPGFEPRAEYMHALAYNKFRENDFEDVAYFEPFYLKDFVPTQPKKNII